MYLNSISLEGIVFPSASFSDWVSDMGELCRMVEAFIIILMIILATDIMTMVNSKIIVDLIACLFSWTHIFIWER